MSFPPYLHRMMPLILQPVFWLILVLLQPGVQSHPLDVMTWNIRYDNPDDGPNAWPLRRDALAQFILEKHPDILGIQEGLDHQVRWLDSVLSGYARVGHGRDDGDRKGEYCAIFYRTDRLRLIETTTRWLSSTPDQPSTGWDAALPRIVTTGRWEDRQTGRVWMVYNTHFDHRGATARSESARLLDTWMASSCGEMPCILMGDLNASPEAEPITWLKQSKRDVLDEADRVTGPSGTFSSFDPEGKPAPRIDYIFLNNGMVRVMEAAILETCRADRCLSDHRPVWCRLTAG